MWQSACSNIFCGDRNFGVNASRSDFLSPSKADLRRMSAFSSSSRRRLPISMSSRVAAFGVVSRNTKASTPIRPATARNADHREIIRGVMA